MLKDYFVTLKLPCYTSIEYIVLSIQFMISIKQYLLHTWRQLIRDETSCVFVNKSSFRTCCLLLTLHACLWLNAIKTREDVCCFGTYLYYVQSLYLVNGSSNEEYITINQTEISLTHDLKDSFVSTKWHNTSMSHEYYTLSELSHPNT